MKNPAVPTLVYDGNCAFCRMWVDYWRRLTGDNVEYVAFQTASARFPEVPEDEFGKAVQFFRDGERYSGAEAVFQLNSEIPNRGWVTALYYKVPALAPLSGLGYRVISANRNVAYWLTRVFWGAHPQPARYETASSLFARAVALIYMIAFISFGRQVRGLIGSQGVQPITDFLIAVATQFGNSARWVAPTLFWWTHSEFSLESIAWSGALLAGVAAIGRPHSSGQKAAFVVLYAYYLSIVTGGQIFMSYQWDFLLLETGFLAVFLKPASWTRNFLFRWLLFRVMFESGAAKIASGDPTWRSLTALSYHFWTQPLPTSLAWHAAKAPMWFLKASTAASLFIELAIPFLIFGPRRLKQAAAVATIALQLFILLTGNYTFFNILTIALCLFLFDDAALSRLRSGRPAIARTGRFGALKIGPANRWVSAALFAFLMFFGTVQLISAAHEKLPPPLRSVLERISAFGVVNRYGLFAVMTTSRPEISIEGSDDGVNWKPYVFKYKPGPLNRPPGWVAPMQPRLDWQMWFAALGSYRENPWLLQFMLRLLQGSAPVLDLLAENPFAGHPPRYIRAELYEYRFTTEDERRMTGDWWKRELKGLYFPPISLRNPAQSNSPAPDSSQPGAPQAPHSQ